MKITKVSAVALMLILASCGNDEITDAEVKSVTEVKLDVETETETEKVTELVEIELKSNDQMQYDQTELKVKAGQEITLTLVHTGEMLKTVMGHNFVLLKEGTDIAAFSTKAIAAKDNDYIPEGDEIIAHTGLIGGGESSSVTFIAPEKGVYNYICSFPGHYGVMKGKFIVE